MELCKYEGDGSPAGVNEGAEEGGGPIGVVGGWSAVKPNPEGFFELLSGVDGEELICEKRYDIFAVRELPSSFGWFDCCQLEAQRAFKIKPQEPPGFDEKYHEK